MNVDEAYYESAIPSNLFDDDIDVDCNDEVPIVEILGQQTSATEPQRYHHLETYQESKNGTKKNSLICDRPTEKRGSIGNSNDEEEDDDTIKALAAAVKIVQSQQQEQPEQKETELYGRRMKQAMRQQQVAEGKEKRQDITLSARLSSSPVIALLSEQEELLLAIDQCQMNISVTDSTSKTSQDPHTHKNNKTKNEDDGRGNVLTSDVSKSPPLKNYPSPNPTDSLRKSFHNYPDHTSQYYSSYSKIDHHEPPRTTSSVTTTTTSACSLVAVVTTASVTDATFPDSRSAFHPFPQNHASQTPYSDPFAFYPSSQFRQQYEHLFQQQCVAHAICEYQQMLRWDVNGTVPPQYPVSPYLYPQSPPTPIGGSFSYQMQHNQWSHFQQQPQHQYFHHQQAQLFSQSHQNIMNPPLPHPVPTYFTRQPQPQYERGLNLMTPIQAPNRPLSTFNPIYLPEVNTSELSSSRSIGNAQEKQGQPTYTIARRPSSPRKYLKPKYVPLKEPMYGTTTTSSTNSAIEQSKSGSQHYRKRSSSTQTTTIPTTEAGNFTQIYPTIPPHPPASIPNTDHQFTENSSQSQ